MYINEILNHAEVIFIDFFNQENKIIASLKKEDTQIIFTGPDGRITLAEFEDLVKQSYSIEFNC